MQVVQRVIPERMVSTYNGTSKDGNPYVVYTWLVKTVTDGKLIAVACFENDHIVLDANKGLLIDCVLSVYCREWNGKYYNDVKMSNAKNPEQAVGTNDVPNTDPILDAENTSFRKPQTNVGGQGLVDEEDTGLPF